MASHFIRSGVEVDSKYFVGNEIGRGVYGVIMQETDHDTGERVAIKFKNFDSATDDCTNNLDIEIIAYERLKGTTGIPRAISYGRNFLAMELLGPSLTDIQQNNRCNPLSMRSVLLIAEQLITRIESIHSNGIFHRDIKKDNILMGLGPNSNVVYVIDFGMAMVDVSKLFQQILRKVDLLMVGHVIKSLYRIPDTTEIRKYFEYYSHLQDDDAVNYKYLREIFQETFHRSGYTGNVIFE